MTRKKYPGIPIICAECGLTSEHIYTQTAQGKFYQKVSPLVKRGDNEYVHQKCPKINQL